MSLSPEEHQLREKYFQFLREATVPFQSHPDLEVALEALIDASQMLMEHFQRELAELRQEQAE